MADKSEPTILVIFGITGDLAGRKVLPALYHLLKDGLLPEKIKVIGTTRQALTKAELLKTVELCVLETDKVCDPVVLNRFNKRVILSNKIVMCAVRIRQQINFIFFFF